MTVVLKPDSIVTQMADMERRLRILENTGRVTPAVTQAGWSVDKYKVRATMSGDQACSSSAFTLVNFDTVSPLPAYDTNANFNTTTHQYTPPVSGWYSCLANVDFTFTGVTDRAQTWGLQLWVNGSIRSSGANPIVYQDAALSTYLESAVNVADLFYMNIGDLLDVRIFGVTNSGNYTAKSAGAGTTFFSVHLHST